MIAFLGLGSNMGDRIGYLRTAVGELRRLGPSLSASPLYETRPVGGPDQPPYLNCVVRLETDLGPADLLDVAHRLEAAAGRARTVRFGPRTLDVDLLLLDDLVIETPELTVPHARMNERGFVLAPLEDLAPECVPPGWRERLGGAAEVDATARRIGNLEPS